MKNMRINKKIKKNPPPINIKFVSLGISCPLEGAKSQRKKQKIAIIKNAIFNIINKYLIINYLLNLLFSPKILV